jgi:hypothetical protein
VLKAIEVRVIVIVPPDPVTRFPVTSADAKVASSNITTAAENTEMADDIKVRRLM